MFINTKTLSKCPLPVSGPLVRSYEGKCLKSAKKLETTSHVSLGDDGMEKGYMMLKHNYYTPSALKPVCCLLFLSTITGPISAKFVQICRKEQDRLIY